MSPFKCNWMHINVFWIIWDDFSVDSFRWTQLILTLEYFHRKLLNSGTGKGICDTHTHTHTWTDCCLSKTLKLVSVCSFKDPLPSFLNCSFRHHMFSLWYSSAFTTSVAVRHTCQSHRQDQNSWTMPTLTTERNGVCTTQLWSKTRQFIAHIHNSLAVHIAKTIIVSLVHSAALLIMRNGTECNFSRDRLCIACY